MKTCTSEQLTLQSNHVSANLKIKILKSVLVPFELNVFGDSLLYHQTLVSQSVGAVEYTDCTSAEG